MLGSRMSGEIVHTAAIAFEEGVEYEPAGPVEVAVDVDVEAFHGFRQHSCAFMLTKKQKIRLRLVRLSLVVFQIRQQY